MHHDTAADWQPTTTPGMALKVLSTYAGGALKTVLFRMAAGTSTPLHSHDIEEEVYVLDGDLLDEGVTLNAGGYLYRPAHFEHAVASHTGCTVLVIYRR